MKLFLDTCSLFKLYHREVDTILLEKLFSTLTITGIYLSEITKVEFTSTIWKKIRTKEITAFEAQSILDLFENDFIKYSFVATDTAIIEQARILTSKYGTQGLRTLDGIQLSTAVSLSANVDLFITADKLLANFMVCENLRTE
jgi:predicted nucleic acid-binding protein